MTMQFLRVAALVLVAGPCLAQQPPVQHGPVNSRAGSSIAASVAALGARPDPVWLGWLVPMIDGERNLCSMWNNAQFAERGEHLESATPATRMPGPAATAGPVSLESGTGLVVLLRVVDGRLERLRTLSNDCPIDASGTSVMWLPDVTPASSIEYLAALARNGTAAAGVPQRMADAAISAIGYHRDTGADAVLDALTLPAADEAIRRQAAAVLGSSRGAHGVDRLVALIRAETNPALRRSFVGALAGTHRPEAAALLLSLAESDPDPRIRALAIYGYAARAGDATVGTVVRLLDRESDDNVKRRAVAGLATLSANASVPALLDLATSNKSPVVRREAVGALGRSTDARAAAYIQELVAK